MLWVVPGVYFPSYEGDSTKESIKKRKEEVYTLLWKHVIMPDVVEEEDPSGNRIRRLKIQEEDPTLMRLKIVNTCVKAGIGSDFFFLKLLFEAKDRVLVEQILKEVFPDRVKAYKKVLDNINV